MAQDIQSLIDQIQNEKDIVAKARLIKNLIREKEIKLVEASQYLSMKPSYISNLLRILKLPELVIDGYHSQSISLAHLLILSRLDEDDAISTYEEVLAQSMTTAQTEQLVREKLYKIKTKGDMIGEDIKQEMIGYFKKLDEELTVQITQTQIKGKVILELKGNRKRTNEFFENLLKHIKE